MRNTSSFPIYLFNRIIRLGGSSVYDIDVNSVNISIENNELVVGKMLLPVPEGKEVEAPYIPCLTYLPSGETFKEIIEFDIPLSPFTWYDAQPLTLNSSQYSLRFKLGYIISSSVINDCIRKVATDYKDEYHAGWFPFESQKVIGTDIIVDNVTAYSSKRPFKHHGRSTN